MGIERWFVLLYNNEVKNKNENLGTVPNLSKKEKHNAGFNRRIK